jgi:hypothetical protein
MGKLIVYRTDGDDFDDGHILTPRGDHASTTLHSTNQEAERLIREAHPDGEKIRANSIYAWKYLAKAEMSWSHERTKNLYELEIDEDDILHTADLDHFAALAAVVGKKQLADDLAHKYWNGPIESERVEILVRKAKVLRKLMGKPEPQAGRK